METIQGQFKTIKVSSANGVYVILLNRPLRKNAINHDMYLEWIKAFDEAEEDSEIRLVLVTGAGDYFSSGNDLAVFSDSTLSLEEEKQIGHDVFFRFVRKFIDFPKPLIAAINGPAYGIAVTTLPFYDAVFAARHATFIAPFSRLGQTPEACSSYTFPLIMGIPRATSMLMFNEKITADEACARGLVTRVFPEQTFQEEIRKIIESYRELPKETLVISKRLIRSFSKEKLHEINKTECEILKDRWTSEDCINAMLKFHNRKQSKL